MRLLPTPIALLFSVFLSACLRDDGIVRPEHPLPVLGRFRGAGVVDATSDTAAGFRAALPSRLLKLTNPQVALVWQFVGPKEFVSAPSTAVVDAKAPFDFTLQLLSPPADEVLDNVDVSIGQFWLYNDENRNGELDRLIHPDMVPMNAAIDSLYRLSKAARREVLATGEVLERHVPWRDTIYVGLDGAVTIHHGDREDTLLSATELGGNGPIPLSVTSGRYKVLGTLNKWQTFFTLRKRDNDYFVTTWPVKGYAYAMELYYPRRVFPRKGEEAEFEAKMRALFLAEGKYTFGAQALLKRAESLHYDDYPYNGDTAGQDFVMARSRSHFVVYLRNRATLAEMAEAERYSSFNVRGLSRLRVGYNLVFCDNQYRCEVLPDGSPVRLDMGMTGEFFNPPSAGVEAPVSVPASASTQPSPMAVPAGALERFAGVYDGVSYGPIRTAVRDGSLWIDVPDEGLLRLVPADTMAFLSPLRNLQVQFVPDDRGGITKAFIVRGSSRFVGTRDSSLREDGLAERVDALLTPAGKALSAARSAGLAGLRLDWAGDTLRLGPAAGDSIWVTVPGMYPQAFRVLDSFAFAGRSMDLRLALVPGVGGSAGGAWVERSGARVFAPAYDYAAPGPRELFPSLPEVLPETVSAHGGGGADRESTLDGKPRFASPEDSLFLRAGDGWVDSLASSHDPGLALVRGGDFLRLRIPSPRDGARAVSVTLQIKAERGAGRRRVLFRLRGGVAASVQEDDLGGPFWVDLADKVVQVVLGPFPARAEPYYVRLERIPTADRAVAVAFGGYVAATD